MGRFDGGDALTLGAFGWGFLMGREEDSGGMEEVLIGYECRIGVRAHVCEDVGSIITGWMGRF